jgi:transcriptional regulator with XRE-family HTH domain
MEELKLIIAKNIADLRKKNGMTQAEFAEKLNYSDKAISKWERGESVPDIATLKQIAEMFGVTIDYLLEEDHTKADALMDTLRRDRKRNNIIITLLSFMLVWLLATIIYVSLTYIPDVASPWHSYVYALPISLIVLLVFNCIWGKRKWTFVLVSLLVWTILAATFIIGFGDINWSVFLIGVPAQIIVLLWSHIRMRKKQI